MTTLQAEKKGKLELLLDDFTEVHGTVLLGMHKELQTLKMEVDTRVETRINAIFDLVKSADSNLHIHVDEAEQVLSKISSFKSELQCAIEQSEHQRSEFLQEIAHALDRLEQQQLGHQQKMSATLKVADKLNTQSLASLKAVNERSEELHQREIAFQQRTRQVTIATGLVVLATLGAWIWLTLLH